MWLFDGEPFTPMWPIMTHFFVHADEAETQALDVRLTVSDASGHKKPAASHVPFEFDQQEFATMVAAHNKFGQNHRLELINGCNAGCVGVVDHREVDLVGVVFGIRERCRIAVETISRITLWSLDMTFTSSSCELLIASLECAA